MSGIRFLSRTGQTSSGSPDRAFDILSDALGVSAVVETLNNPRFANGTESSFLGPFFTEDAPDRSSCLVVSFPSCLCLGATAVIPVAYPDTSSPALPILPQFQLASRSRRRERVNICTSRDACSIREESLFLVQLSIRGRQTARVRSIVCNLPHLPR
jgi:hypothetical protein